MNRFTLQTADKNVIKPARLNNDSRNALTVERSDNHVYFYSEVTSDRGLALIKHIRAIDEDLRVERDSRSLPDDFPYIPIYLHINSGGGELFTGLLLADQLKTFKTPIHSIIEGFAASAATLMSISCTKRYITKNSFFMIHQLSGVMWGTHEEFEDNIKLQNMEMENIMRIYQQNGKLKRKELEKMLKHDSWMNAEMAIEAGFVDEIFKG